MSLRNYRPARALLHPLWMGSLALLALNDHVLKGASILPGSVTGKLSDFAGLIVAPALLAAVLRLRSRRGWIAAHVAVGAGFSAIQISAAAAGAWSAAMAMVGFPWVITRDLTDLVALPALLISAFVLGAVAQRRDAKAARRSAEYVAGGVGLVCCAATSPPSEPFEPFRPSLWTDVYVHNAGDDDIVVRMRPLSSDTDMDCDVIEMDPGRLLSEPLFGNSQSFRLEPDQNFGLRTNSEFGWENEFDDSDREPVDGCYAYLLDVDGMPPTIVMWRDGSIPEREVSGDGEPDSELRGAIDIVPSENPDNFGEYIDLGNAGIVFPVPETAPPATGSCAPQGDGTRLDWSEPTAVGTWQVAALDRGPDGCFAFDLGYPSVDQEPEIERRWYLCAPLQDMSLLEGRVLDIGVLNASGAGEGGISIVTADDDPSLPTIEVQVFRGNLFPEFNGVSVAAVPEFECDYAVEPMCGTVTRPTAVTAGGGDMGAVQIFPGESQTLEGQAGTMTVAVAHAEERAAHNDTCAEGPASLGLDLEVAALLITPAAG